MKNKLFFTGLLLLLLSQAVWAQSGSKINFKKSTYDFGEIKEQNGTVEHKFVFTNTGNAPLIIEKVKASCGCTTPAWTKEPILPGKAGFIHAKFDPKGRPGSFNKSLTITSNATPNTQRIYIKGMVVKKPVALTDDFRVKKGNLGLKYSILNLGTVDNNAPLVKKFELANLGKQTIRFTGKNKVPAHIKLSISPSSIAPKKKATITITYDGKAKNDFGRLYDYVTIGTNDSEKPDKQIRIAASVEEYFPHMSDKELAKAPKLILSDKSFDFKEIKEGEIIKHKFRLTNNGKKPLIIRKTKTTCGCTASQLLKKNLAPGESTEMTVTFNSKGRKGKQYKTITLITNDPINPTQRLSIKGNVLAKK